jgi:hypothetical protein
MWIGAGVVAVALVLYVVLSSAPTDEADLPGAIGVAQQYRADQITDADVVLADPEIQNLLQSEFFYKLTTDQEFRKVAVDQLARMELVANRSAPFASASDLASMKNFLDLVLGDGALKQALAEGRMDVVNATLIRENRHEFLDIANRIYLTQGRHPALNLASYGDMKLFLDQALGNAQLRMALADGRMTAVDQALQDSKHPHLLSAAQKVFLAENRGPHLDCAGLADMKVFLDFAAGNADLRAALAEGRLERVDEILDASNRTELANAAHRIHLTNARHPQLGSVSLSDMKLFLDSVVENRDLKAALMDGRLERVDAILVKDGKAALNDAAGKVHLTDRRQPHLAEASLQNLKLFLDFSASNADLKAALAEGKMNLVQETLLQNGKAEFIDAANRIYGMHGQIQINEPMLGDMKLFLDHAAGDQNLKAALIEGRAAQVDEALVKDGKMSLCLAANRVCLVENRRPQLASYTELGSMRAITDFAAENAEFRQALQNGRLDAAARVALASGRHDISLRNLQAASFVVGENRNFVPELNRLVNLADTPSFKMAVQDPGWGRLVATADAGSWKQTVEAVHDGKMFVQQ